MSRVIVAGAGAAGMMAACAAAMCGHEVLLLEKNEKCGKKLYITGKGRCNLTNAAELPDLFASVPRNSRFLYSSLYTFDNQAVMNFFESNGLPLKIERGNRVFPRSDHASDVIKTLESTLLSQGVRLSLNTEVREIVTEDRKITGVRAMNRSSGQNLSRTQKGPGISASPIDPGRQEKTGSAVSCKNLRSIPCDALILACGGCSYPATGSDGGGFSLASSCGHSITALSPSLVPMNVKEDYVRELQGLSLKNVTVSIYAGEKCIYEEFGEMLFTHFGVSGPLILRASSRINRELLSDSAALPMKIDLKPALTIEQLDHRLQRMFSEHLNKTFKNSLSGLLPAKLLPLMIRLSGIDPDRRIHSVTKEERLSFAALLKAFPCTVTGLRGFDEAVITRGGVSTREINPSTMESKLVKGLYFAGEMIDVDALTGGFNLQIAWSTGYLAGSSI